MYGKSMPTGSARQCGKSGLLRLFKLIDMPAAPAPAALRLSVAAACVVALHALALWGVQYGLQSRLKPLALRSMRVEMIVPPAHQPVAPPAPKRIEPPAPKPAKPPKPVAQRAPQPAPQPIPLAEPQPAPQADPQPAAEPVLAAATQPGTGAPAPAPAAPAPVRAATGDGPPSTDAQCGNQKPPYPGMSSRLGETGEVLLSVLIGTDGKVQDVRLLTSSGYPRLDDAALKAVYSWRCQPVVRNGVPQAAWRNRTVVFELR